MRNITKIKQCKYYKTLHWKDV